MKKFDGKELARKKERELKRRVEQMSRQPRLMSVLVGKDEASKLYVSLKKKAAERVGIDYGVFQVSYPVSKERVQELIRRESSQYDGVMVQLPLPGKLRKQTETVLAVIPLDKDVDGLRWQESGVMPATVKAVMTILEEIEKEGEGDLWKKRMVVVGAKGNVGRPLVYFLRARGARVEEVDIDTVRAREIIRGGEIVISCVGKPSLLGPEEIKAGSIVVDVGISKVEGKVAGDVAKEAYEKAKVIVPVPGGVGPMTIVSLLENVVEKVEE